MDNENLVNIVDYYDNVAAETESESKSAHKSVRPKDIIVLRHIITLAKELGFTCLAEGAETKKSGRLSAQFRLRNYSGLLLQ